MDEHTKDRAKQQFASWCFEMSDEMGRVFTNHRGPSEQVREHFRNSRVEFLKGLRRMIDDKIERVQRRGPMHGTSVRVD